MTSDTKAPIRTASDLTLETLVTDYARWESRDVEEKAELRDFYLDTVRKLRGEARVVSDDVYAVEVHYTLPLRHYLRWPDVEYDQDSLMNAIAASYPDLGLEPCGAQPAPVRDAVEARLVELYNGLPESEQTK